MNKQSTCAFHSTLCPKQLSAVVLVARGFFRRLLSAGGLGLSSTRLGGSKRGSIPTDDGAAMNNTDDSVDGDEISTS